VTTLPNLVRIGTTSDPWSVLVVSEWRETPHKIHETLSHVVCLRACQASSYLVVSCWSTIIHTLALRAWRQLITRIMVCLRQRHGRRHNAPTWLDRRGGRCRRSWACRSSSTSRFRGRSACGVYESLACRSWRSWSPTRSSTPRIVGGSSCSWLINERAHKRAYAVRGALGAVVDTSGRSTISATSRWHAPRTLSLTIMSALAWLGAHALACVLQITESGGF